MNDGYSRHVQDKEMLYSRCEKKAFHYSTSGFVPIADEGVDFPCSIKFCLLLVRSSQEWRNPSGAPGPSNMVIFSLECQCSPKGPEEEIEARPSITFEAKEQCRELLPPTMLYL